MKSTLVHEGALCPPEISLPHNQFFETLIKKEYARLKRTGQVYLDYTGGNLYPESLVTKHHSFLKDHVFGNPHSTNPTSQLATRLVEEAREKVIQFFNAEDYVCVFTQNASGALKIVGECFPFEDDGRLLLLADNHNSVNGIREYCARRGGGYEYCPVQYEDLRIKAQALEIHLRKHRNAHNKLFAYPAQSNVSGVKHDLSWIGKAQELGWDVLLDAAAFVPTNKLDLQVVKPDFVCVSFYKIFGYPTGVGCLLVKRSKFHKLNKPWFAGGTVTLASVSAHKHYLATDHERFENGTINYLDIPAIKDGLEFIESIGIDKLNHRVTSLTAYMVARLKSLQHTNGQQKVKIFGPEVRDETGGNIIITILDEYGERIPFELVEEATNKANISIRSGCFCNPGIDEVNSCISTQDLSAYFTSRCNGDYQDMVRFLQKMRGATRISVGIATSKEDLDKLVDLISLADFKRHHVSSLVDEVTV